MGAVYFYHLIQTPLEVTLPMLLGKARKAGWRVLVRSTSAEHLAALDERLWLGPEDQFLPHGVAGGPFDRDQPVLLSDATDNPTGAGCVMAVHGAAVAPEEVNALERACILFDGTDPVAVDVARAHWRTLTAAGCAAQYWSQDGGTWTKKAEHPAA